LSAERRALPWEYVDKQYVFEGPNGRETLAELFAGRSQLVVYHFMLGPNWEEGCKGCSFWADNFNGIDIHLAHRDVTLLAISSAPSAKINAYRQCMGWSFKWVSSSGCEFNKDYQVTFTPEDLEKGEVFYNYAWVKSTLDERPGISVFYKDAAIGAKPRGSLDFPACPGSGEYDSVVACRRPPICPTCRVPSWKLGLWNCWARYRN
jgi:predicted dithiol-disulfide oxidoreductase (DUF899 family)